MEVLKNRAVSEAVGTIILVGMVMIGVVLVGMLLLSGQTATTVPVFDSIISNQSKIVYIYHKGGDSLYAGTYKIFVNGNDSTSYFSIMSPYGDPFSVGKTLVGTLPYIPVHVAIVFNQTGGGATVLAEQDLYGTSTLAQNP
ncbi:MAG TPA: type IV pilin N-terminal domain-containing protein, partial [Methanomicrobiales archaeon]|nr:type IV pilin N-terminal domain-containing protein [Methanomicrobiales archaeon]